MSSLKEELLCCLDDPLFPKTEVKQGAARVFEPVGLMREHWSNATPVRKIFKGAFERVGLPYFNPHSIRNTLTLLGEHVCKGNIEAFKAWSQNLGHENMLTTLTSYGTVARDRQREIMRQISSGRTAPDAYSPEVLEMADKLVKAGIGSL